MPAPKTAAIPRSESYREYEKEPTVNTNIQIDLDWEEIFDKYEAWSDAQTPQMHSMNLIEQRAIKRIINAQIRKALAGGGTIRKPAAGKKAKATKTVAAESLAGAQ